MGAELITSFTPGSGRRGGRDYRTVFERHYFNGGPRAFVEFGISATLTDNGVIYRERGNEIDLSELPTHLHGVLLVIGSYRGVYHMDVMPKIAVVHASDPEVWRREQPDKTLRQELGHIALGDKLPPPRA